MGYIQYIRYIKLKFAILVHLALSGHTPRYLADKCLIIGACPKRLRSADTHTFHVCVEMNTKFGDRAFCAAGPQVCNYLHTDLRQTVTEDIFICSVGPKMRCEYPFNFALRIILLTY